MAELSGFAARAYYKKATTWGTAVTVTAATGDQFEYASESVVPDVALIDSDQITGAVLTGASDTGAISVVGDVAGQDMLYQGKERWIRDVFGAYANDVAPGGTTARQHKFDFATSNEGFFGTLVFEKIVTVHEADSFKPMSLTFSGQPGNFLKLGVGGIGRRVFIADPGRTNDTTPADALPTYARLLARFGHVSVVVADLGGANPVTLCVSGFEFRFVRNTNPAQTTCDGDYSSEPSTDTVEITGTLDFPIYDTDNNSLVQSQLDKGSRSMTVTIDSGVDIPGDVGGGNYRALIYIPGFQFTTGWPSVGGRGRVPLSLQFKAHLVASVDALDTDAVLPRIKIFNEVLDIDDYAP